MTRREFITLLGGAAAAWPLGARAQQPERMRRVGVLNTLAADDGMGQARNGVFLQGLQQAGWTIGRNVQVETRWAGADADRIRTYAAELVASRRMSSSPPAMTAQPRCCKRHAACRSCFPSPTIRSVPAWSITWRARAATPPVS